MRSQRRFPTRPGRSMRVNRLLAGTQVRGLTVSSIVKRRTERVFADPALTDIQMPPVLRLEARHPDEGEDPEQADHGDDHGDHQVRHE